MPLRQGKVADVNVEKKDLETLFHNFSLIFALSTEFLLQLENQFRNWPLQQFYFGEAFSLMVFSPSLVSFPISLFSYFFPHFWVGPKCLNDGNRMMTDEKI